MNLKAVMARFVLVLLIDACSNEVSFSEGANLKTKLKQRSYGDASEETQQTKIDAESSNQIFTKEQEFPIRVDRNVIDILMVIDDSGSMSREQEQLANKLLSITKYIKDLDWQIGVITTDSRDDSCLAGVISHKDAEAETLFENVIADLGLKGSYDERGIFMAKRGLTCSDFVRENSSIAIIVISDEDNCSSGCGDSIEKGAVGTLQSYLLSIRDPKHFTFNAIVHRTEEESRITGGNVARDYVKAASDMGGITAAISADNYTSALEGFSKLISETVYLNFELKFPPLSRENIKIMNGEQEITKFDINGKNVVLRSNVDPEQGIKFIYDYDEEAVAKELEEARIAKELEEARIAKELEEVRIAKELEEARIAKELEEARITKELEEARITKQNDKKGQP